MRREHTLYGTQKQGDTLLFTLDITNPLTGLPTSGIAEKLTGQVKQNLTDVTPLADLTITESETPGTYICRADTKTFPTSGRVFFDIHYTDGDYTVSSQTFVVYMEGAVTQ